MEALIAAMRRPSAQPAGSAAKTDDERLALAAWRAIQPAVLADPVTDPRPRAELPLEPGATLGRYVVRRPLGAGGMGVVYEAHDPELDRMVALKLVPPDRIGHEHRTRLLREAQALARLSHPNVVKVFDVGTRGEQLWVAMERVHGQTLREWLRTPRSWRGVLRVMQQAASGLAAAHQAGLLHRDFKPENVMLGDDGVVRVMDFDLARSLPDDGASAEPEVAPAGLVPTLDTLALSVTQTEVLVGTPGYMAPEQLLGEPLTPAADQFALCVSLWEGLFGERPFTGDTLDELVRNVLAGVPARPRTEHAVPGWLRRTCERGLAVRPEARFESIDALLTSLGRGRLRARAWIGVLAAGVLAAVGVGVEACGRLDRPELDPPLGAHGRSP
jgi:serine/threonine protein kinase